MSYTVNGKVYTDHPLMDSVVQHMGIIMNSIEIKDEELATKYESKETLEASDTYMSIMSGNAKFETFQFRKELLLAYGYDDKTAYNITIDRYLVPEGDRQVVFEFCCKKFIEDYVEKNNYYRALIGEPWLDEYGDNDYTVYIDESYVPPEPYLEGVMDYSIPVHKFSNYQIAVLKATGGMDRIYNEYTGKEYKYLHFLGDTRLNLYDVRRAAKWDILYIPPVELMVSDRFKQLYSANKEIYLHRFYSEAYKISSDYYDQFMIILLLCQTYTDMIADLPEWYIRRDIFDLRSCQYFLESHGIEFFKIIPLKYQIRLVKNMNKLIKYKSTNKNIWDIIDLFAVENTVVYKYYLFKKRIANEHGSYANGKDPSEEYELEFVKAPIGTSYDDTIKDNIYREPYDDITYQDKYWDGQDYHENVKALHMAKDFTIEGTKYISLEDRVSTTLYYYQLEFFLGLLMDSAVDLSDITISIPQINSLIPIPLSDIFILLAVMTAGYEDYTMLIRTPLDNYTPTDPKPEFEKYKDVDGGYVYDRGDYDLVGGSPDIQARFRDDYNGGRGPEYIFVTQETFYDWIRWKYPYIWTDMTARIAGFNMEADLEELAEIVGFRHSAFQFERGYTLEELGVAGYIATDRISTIDELMRIYMNNSEIHDHLKDMILNAETRDDKVVYQFVFDYLFTRKFDYKRYTLASGELATAYEEILRERNYILYKFYTSLMSETNLDTRRDAIRGAMNDIISTLDYYLSYDCIKFVFGSYTVTSFNSLLNYIRLVINFFKSYKVYFLDTYVTYCMDDKSENTVEMKDQIMEMKLNYWKTDKLRYRDAVSLGVELCHHDAMADNQFEVLDIYGHLEPDPTLDTYLDGGGVEDDDDTTEFDGGGVSVESCAPSYTYDGGDVGLGKRMHDMDGAGVQEQQFYLDLDGEYPDNGLRQGTYLPQEGYDMDGGHPSMFHYRTPGMLIARLYHNRIAFDVKVANQIAIENLVEIKRDGLYIKDIWASDEDGQNLYDKMLQLLEDLKKCLSDSDYMLKTIEYAWGLIHNGQKMVDEDAHEYLDTAVDTVNDIMINNVTLDANKAYADKMAQALYDLIHKDGVLSLGWEEIPTW